MPGVGIISCWFNASNSSILWAKIASELWDEARVRQLEHKEVWESERRRNVSRTVLELLLFIVVVVVVGDAKR